MRAEATGSWVEQCRDTQINNAMASYLAKKTRGSTTAGAGRACSNEESQKNKYSNSTPKSVGSVCTMQPICNKYG